MLTPLNSSANHTYTAAGSPLNGDSALFVSPSNGFFNKTASPLWPTTIWDTQPDGTGTGYLTAFAALTDVTLSGVSNGEPDANGIWHNSQYYEYTVSSLTLAANTGTNGWGAAGTYFLFSPSSSSQTQGLHADQRGHAAGEPVRRRAGHGHDVEHLGLHHAHELRPLRHSRQRAAVGNGRNRQLLQSLGQQPVWHDLHEPVHGLHRGLLGARSPIRPTRSARALPGPTIWARVR